MPAPRLHLLSIAGGNRQLAEQLGLDGTAALVGHVQEIVGPALTVTTNARLIGAEIDEQCGGRTDDAERVAELDACFADERVRALVSLRGGAWLTRILGDVDFTLLQQRRAALYICGFSELTSLVNIAARYPCVQAVYDLGPAYLRTSLRMQARADARDIQAAADFDGSPSDFARSWARTHFPAAFRSFFEDLAAMVHGAPSRRVLSGRVLAEPVPRSFDVRAVGGCLAVLVALCGSRFQQAFDVADHWLALEDVREDPYRIDRYFAQLKLCGVFERCAGLLLGDFSHDEADQTAAIMALLKHHLPAGRNLPVIGHCNFGHRHNVAPLPLRRPLRATRQDDGQVVFEPRAGG